MNSSQTKFFTALAAVALWPVVMTAAESKLNVLFIVSDDLKPDLGCYGNTFVKSPNIDRLAARGVLFERAYVQQAVCSPSRSSLLTGRRPDTTQVYDLVTHFRTAIPDVVTLPQYFKANGYLTQSFGKIYHPEYDDEPSWTVQNTFKHAPRYSPAGQVILAQRKKEVKPGKKTAGLPWEAPDVPDETLTDGSVAAEAVKRLGELAKGEQPFFLAVGFLTPHLPFAVPKKYWDLYRHEDIKVPKNFNQPVKDGVSYSGTDWGELRKYKGMPAQGPLGEEDARMLIHGYYASVSHVDAQIGKLIDAVEQLGLKENTVIILWGDHGWHLGDHGQWTKHTNFEQATHAPLIISVPGTKNAGKKSNALVEFVDVYPTLAEACGLPAPKGVEGTSLAPLLAQPDRAWKPAAFSQFVRPGGVMGYSIRTDRYRYTEWLGPKAETLAQELYDHQVDAPEDINVAARAENKDLVKRLHDQIEQALHVSTIKRDPSAPKKKTGETVD